MNDAALQTVFLTPGTKVVYVKAGEKVVETVETEIEVELLGIDGDDTYLVRWAAAPGGEAFATEPVRS
jgi:hypothetical protein